MLYSLSRARPPVPGTAEIGRIAPAMRSTMILFPGNCIVPDARTAVCDRRQAARNYENDTPIWPAASDTRRRLPLIYSMTSNSTVRASAEDRTTDDVSTPDDATDGAPTRDAALDARAVGAETAPDDRRSRYRHDFDGDRRPSVSVVLAVSNALDADPLELDERLYEAVDPDALDRLLENCESAACRVTFELAGRSVTVRADGRIVVRRDA